MKLNQVIAIEKNVKNKANDALTKFYHSCQKLPLFSGQLRAYVPLDDEGEKLPREVQPVQMNADAEKYLVTRDARYRDRCVNCF